MKKGDFQRLAVNPPAYANYFGQPRVLLGTLGIVELNINGFPFPGWSTVEKSRQVAHIILPVLNKLKGVNWSFQSEMSELDSIQRRFLLERMQITYAMAARNEACHVLINDKQDMEAYVNDEEELLILRFFPGEEDSISRAEDTCRKLRDELTELLPVARHPKFGYLSACPEQTGSGLWYSFLLHTPALQSAIADRTGTTGAHGSSASLPTRQRSPCRPLLVAHLHHFFWDGGPNNDGETAHRRE